MIPRSPMSPKGLRRALEKRKRAELLAKELEVALRDEQGPAQPRAHWRYPYGIGAHAIALCALAAAAALGVLAHVLS